MKKLLCASSLVLSLCSSSIALSMDNPMLQSVMLPTEEKGLGLLGTINYYCRTNVNNAIAYLTSKTFDVTNKSHFNLLNKALEDAADNYDYATIATIVALCHSTEEYKKNIRISDEAAASALNANIIDAKYVNNVQQAKDTIEKSLQEHEIKYNERREAFHQALALLVSGYTQDLTAISDSFNKKKEEETARVQDPILKLAALNKSIRKDADSIVTTHRIKIRRNEIATNVKITDMTLQHLIKRGESLPKIEIKTDNALSLTDK